MISESSSNENSAIHTDSKRKISDQDTTTITTTAIKKAPPVKKSKKAPPTTTRKSTTSKRRRTTPSTPKKPSTKRKPAAKKPKASGGSVRKETKKHTTTTTTTTTYSNRKDRTNIEVENDTPLFTLDEISRTTQMIPHRPVFKREIQDVQLLNHLNTTLRQLTLYQDREPPLYSPLFSPDDDDNNNSGGGGGSGDNNKRVPFFNVTSNPVSILHSQIRDLFSEPYYVCEKSDGVRYVLLLTRWQDQQFACMCDRNGSFFQIQVTANDFYFDGTLVDGELVIENHLFLCYWVFDVYCVAGESTIRNGFSKRSHIVSNIFETLTQELYFDESMSVSEFNRSDRNESSSSSPPQPNAIKVLNPLILDNPQIREYRVETLSKKQSKIVADSSNEYHLRLVAKPVYPMDKLHLLWYNQDRIFSHACDGLIFTPDKSVLPVGGTFRRQYKWKQEHTIDLILQLKRRSTDTLGHDSNSSTVFGVNSNDSTTVHQTTTTPTPTTITTSGNDNDIGPWEIKLLYSLDGTHELNLLDQERGVEAQLTSNTCRLLKIDPGLKRVGWKCKFTVNNLYTRFIKKLNVEKHIETLSFVVECQCACLESVITHHRRLYHHLKHTSENTNDIDIDDKRNDMMGVVENSNNITASTDQDVWGTMALEIVRFRDDKSTPNGAWTIGQTLLNVEENIQIYDFIAPGNNIE